MLSTFSTVRSTALRNPTVSASVQVYDLGARVFAGLAANLAFTRTLGSAVRLKPMLHVRNGSAPLHIAISPSKRPSFTSST
jgi:hypothetical protein